MTLTSYINEQDYNEYMRAIEVLETHENINEGVLDKLTGGIKKKVSFITDIANNLKIDVKELIPLFKDSKVYKFFKTIGFSFKKLYGIIKTGFKAYEKVQKVIAQYVAETKIGKWTEKNLQDLDDYINEHPLLNKMTGVAVGGILLYIWLNMAFTGDFSYDFDFTDIINALQGEFSLASLFAGVDGNRLLMLFATGAFLGLSFPWAGPTSIQLVGGVIKSLYKMAKNKELKIPGLK